jgi:tetratricopeptide (TPR) repeat protein
MRLLKMTLSPIYQKILLSAVLSLSLLSTALPARADYIADHYAVFETSLREAVSAYQNQKEDQAFSSLQKAREAVSKFEQEAAKQQQTDSPKFIKAHQAMRVDLVRLLSALAGSYYKQENAQQVQKAYTQALELAPTLPLLHFHMAYLQVQLGQPALALSHLYEAKRLNRLPQMRWLINPFDQNLRIGATAKALDHECDKLLTQLGQATNYPIERDPVSGQASKALLVPGIGANLRTAAGNSYANIYFNTPEAQLFKLLGPTSSSEKNSMLIVQFGPPTTDPTTKPLERKLVHYLYPTSHCTVSVDAATKQVYMIQSEEPGYQVYINKEAIAIGDPIARVQKVLGGDYGFQAYDLKGGAVSKMLLYPALGLVIGINSDGKVAALNLQSLD